MKTLPSWLKQISGIILLVGTSAAFIVLYNEASMAKARNSSCQSNLKQIALAYGEYLRDYDGRYPPVVTDQGKGWADVLSPYRFEIHLLYQCPSGQQLNEQGTIDYFYNSQLSRVLKVTSPDKTILAGDGEDNGHWDANYSDLPLPWKNESNSPAKRHLHGANYAFADGHVKWFKPENISALSNPPENSVTFAIK